MIPVYRWDVSVVTLEGLKFLKWSFPLKFFKIVECAVLHWGTTVQMKSGRSMIFDPVTPHCQNEDLLQIITSIMI
jgi:hypothetical protein